jgi:hypothetical protein
MRGKVVFDVIVQGPSNDKDLNILYNSMDFSVVNQIIYSDCSNSISLKRKNLAILKHKDPGSNIGNYRKPLNINRFLEGVKNSMGFSTSRYILIIRSDIQFSLDLLLAKLDLQKLNVIDVTTKKFWLKDKWEYHFCDWLYYGEKAKIERMIFNTDYSDLPITFQDSLYPCSPEYLLMYNYFKYNKLTDCRVLDYVNVVFSSKIELKSLKKGYEIIPFGVNKVYGIKPKDIVGMDITSWKYSYFYAILLKIKAKLVC